MDISMNTLLIFLGSFLTFLGTWMVEWWKNGREKNEKALNFKLLVRQELLAMSKGLEKLKVLLETRGFYDIYVLKQLEKSIDDMGVYKRDAVYLPYPRLQERFIDLISDISIYVGDARGLQEHYWGESKRLREGRVESRDGEQAQSSQQDAFTRFGNLLQQEENGEDDRAS